MLSEMDGIRVALVGCGHGGLDEIYQSLKTQAEAKGWETIDLVVIGGDFQALRNANDAACISVPSKWKKMGDFHKYYAGQSIAPYLTIFCGGNHEASNFMYELYYGGWVAHNIYYLGAANLVRFGPLRISAMSGIWKGYDYRKPHYERLPYNADDLHSIYHIRELDVRKLLQIRTQVDIGLSHDWPRGIEYFGDYKELFRKKRGFKEDSEHGRLGNVAARDVLDRLRPPYWFSAHLHVKFPAAMPHDGASLRKIEFPADQPPVWGVEAQAPVASSSVVSPVSAPLKTKARSPAPANIRSPFKAEPQPESVGSTTDSIFDSHGGPSMASNQVREASGLDHERRNAWMQMAGGAAQAFEHQTRVDHQQAFLAMIQEMKKGNSETKAEAPAPNDAPKNDDEIDLDSGSESDKSGSGNPSPVKAAKLIIPISTDGSDDAGPTPEEPLVDRAVAEGMRSKLPSSFSRPAAPANVHENSSNNNSRPRKPVPAAISNKLTRFLALDKPHNRDDFLHLTNIRPFKTGVGEESPTSKSLLRLQYDKEWLAITRVFANDLALGDVAADVPADQGEDFYLSRIMEEEKWVEEHLVQQDLMNIPYNFQHSAPKFDPEVSITTPSSLRSTPTVRPPNSVSF
ncbi:Lariat debranching enzyme [Penicillium canariense]|uniref:Lariat debranching enzyme n=1 Tax=Penicillium canariense TaxID=189055 RepID=A0A9W9HXI2_9EURO|nr:Lariat debranching enzyme [Penicillium canariense]KAJ5159525.1 Lariat debranching enzyme [Penicillium canariense]